MRSKLGNIKIGRRLSIGFGIVLLISFSLGVFAVYQLKALSQLTEHMYLHPLAVSNAVNDIKANINTIHCAMKDVVTAENIEIINQAALHISKCEKEVFQDFNLIFERFLGKKNDVTNAYNLFTKWKVIRNEVISLSRQGNKDKAAEIVMGMGLRHAQEMNKKIQIMIDFAKRKAKSFRNRASQIQRRIIITMTGLIILMSLTGLIVSIVITKSIITPLDIVVKAIRNLSRGYLNEEVTINQKDEIGQLADSFRELQDDLRHKAFVSKQIAAGKFSIDVPPRSSKDDFGISFFAMTSSLKKAASDLAGSELKYRSVIESLPIGIAVSAPDGRILDANPAILKMFSIDSKEEFTNYPASEYYHNPDDRKKYIGLLKEKGMVNGFEVQVKRKDGTQFWGSVSSIAQADEQNKMIYINSFIDINEKKMAAQKLKEESERFQVLFNNAIDAIFVYPLEFDNTVGTFIEVNKIACNRLGYTKQELLQMSPYDISETNLDKDSHIIKKLRTGGGYIFETAHITKKGEKIPVEVSSFLVELKGNPIIMSITRDITERKKAEVYFKKAKDEAEAANKAKSIFLANMSHEIRTPMNGIIGMADLVIETDLTQSQQKYMGNIKKSIDSLMEIINDILDFSKIESKKIVIQKLRFNIRESIESCVLPLIEIGRNKNLEVYYRIDNDIPDYLTGDSHRLNQVIINLMGNAIKFTEKGEIGLIVTRRSKNDKNVVLQFTVHDTGIGIPLEKQKVIFDPFSQSDDSFTRSYGGTGLGLSITRQLVELMEGEIWLKSKPGKGSTFYFSSTFSIPDEQSCEMSSLEDKIPEKTPETTKQKGLNILLAEDNEMNQEVAIAFLETRNHSVVVAETGAEAVEFVKKEQFDCVLMDVQMPVMDGIEATIQIREFEKTTGSHIPIIAMTAHAIKGEAEQFIKVGMDGYISKPFKANELFKIIEDLYEKYHV